MFGGMFEEDTSGWMNMPEVPNTATAIVRSGIMRLG